MAGDISASLAALPRAGVQGATFAGRLSQLDPGRAFCDIGVMQRQTSSNSCAATGSDRPMLALDMIIPTRAADALLV